MGRVDGDSPWGGARGGATGIPRGAGHGAGCEAERRGFLAGRETGRFCGENRGAKACPNPASPRYAGQTLAPCPAPPQRGQKCGKSPPRRYGMAGKVGVAVAGEAAEEMRRRVERLSVEMRRAVGEVDGVKGSSLRALDEFLEILETGTMRCVQGHVQWSFPPRTSITRFVSDVKVLALNGDT
ncbi:hypothetical protein Sjap_011449 [Stephania japonica]|uniref:Uncharacterized protein n=1 Tax=Stephania japonica TaxID=461633 RepID=A0AAP0JB51_9MAGN